MTFSDISVPGGGSPNRNSSSSPEVSSTPEERRAGLEKLGLLVFGIAHNLAGPLAGILGTIDVLKLKYPDMSKDFERISRMGKRLQGDIRLLIQKARLEFTGEVVPVNLVELIHNEVDFYKADSRFKHKTEVTLEAPEKVPVFLAVYGDFSQSFANLLTNAMEAMEEVDDKRLDIRLRHEEDLLILSVTDNGVGMDEETRRRAFEPFFTTKIPHEQDGDPPILAAGIGLTHARNLLEPLGCKFEVESQPTQGCTITLAIPYKEIDEYFKAKMANLT